MSSKVSLSDFRPSGVAFTGSYGRYHVILGIREHLLGK